MRGRTVLHAAGYGRTASGSAVTPSTAMPVASLSKAFTSLAVMQLVEAGRIDLDKPVVTYLPDFAVDDPRGGAITLRHLLTHTSGLSDSTFHEKSGPAPASLSAVDPGRMNCSIYETRPRVCRDFRLGGDECHVVRAAYARCEPVEAP